MKLRAERSALLDALKAVLPASGGFHDVGNGVRIVAESDEVTVECSDGERQAVATVTDAAIENEGVTIMPARLAVSFVNSLNDGAVVIEMNDDKATIVGGESVFDSQCYPAEAWPRFSPIESDPIDLTEHWHGIRSVVHSASVDIKRAELCTVKLGPDGAMATDSYRCAWYKSALTDVAVLVPATVMETIAKIDGDTTTFTTDGRATIISRGGVAWRFQLVQDKYPDVARLLRPSSPMHVTCSVKELQATLARVALLDDGNGFRNAHLMMDGGKLTVTSATSKYGQITDTITAEGNYDETAKLRAPFLLDVLAVLSGDEVTIGFDHGYKPLVIIEGDFVEIVMQIKPDAK